MTQIRIDEITDSKSGKSWRVKSGDKWYGASKDLLSASDKGKVFEVKISASDFGPWIDSAKAPETRSIGPETGIRAYSDVTVAPWYMPFISNCVAHAISAGLVKEPTDVKVWVLAAKQAAESMDDVPY
jgi:hypothetical protein